MQRQTYETKGGVRVHREIAVQPYSPADTRAGRAARRPARRAVLVELRVSRPLHALGHGLRRSAAGAHRARPRLPIEALNERGRGAAAGDRRGISRASTRCEHPTQRRRPDRRATSARAASASPRRSAAASRRSSRCCARSSSCSPARRTSTSGSTARSATTSPSSSSRCSCGCARPDDQRDLVLYLPDEILIVDHMRQQSRDPPLRLRGRRPRRPPACRARRRRAPVSRPSRPPVPPRERPRARRIRRAGRAAPRRRSSAAICSRSVRGQIFSRAAAPTRRALSSGGCAERNPAPYGFLINLGEGEYLVGASPEMYVRVDGRPRRDLPDLAARSRAAATRSKTPSRSANCSTRPRTSPS